MTIKMVATCQMQDDDDGPPTQMSTEPLNMRARRYPETTDHSHTEDLEEPGLFKNMLIIACIAIGLAHVWTMWTLRADVNIIMAYHKENAQQTAHISTLLQNMQQVQWQMVPTIH